MGLGPHGPAPAGQADRNVADMATRTPVKKKPPVTLIERRLAFEQRHPNVTIFPSGQTKSGLWEADWLGRVKPAQAEDCAGLLDYLDSVFDP